MPAQKNKVVGRYGRPKKKKGFRVKFRFGRKFFYLTLLAIIAGGTFYFLFISDKFEIKEVNITGFRTVNEEEVRNAANNILDEKKLAFAKFRNSFLFSGERLRASLLKSFPKIARVGVGVSTDILDISLEERNVLGVWCLTSRDRSGDCFYFDREGVIFEEAPQSFGQLILNVRDSRNIKPSLGESILDEKWVLYLADLKGITERNFTFGIQTIEILESGEFEIVTSDGWRVLLNKNDSVSSQLSNLKYVLDDVIKNRRGELEYVDLRLGNKVYYKY